MRKISLIQFSKIVIAIFLITQSATVKAQVGIGILTPEASAQLEVSSTTKGMLVPRMTSAQRTAISSPANALLVYQTDAPVGFYYYNSIIPAWVPMTNSAIGTGFSASASPSGLAASTQITNFSTASPFISSASFDAVAGNFTVPETGTYLITANVNYNTTAALTVSLGAGVSPAFEVRRTSPSVTTLMSGNFPILNVNIALVLTLRAILGSGTVAMNGKVQLTAGDVIGLFYNADGLTVPIDLTGGSASGVVWSITRVN